MTGQNKQQKLLTDLCIVDFKALAASATVVEIVIVKVLLLFALIILLLCFAAVPVAYSYQWRL